MGHELIVPAVLGDDAALQNDDAIGHLHRGKTVRDEQSHLTLGQLRETFKYLVFGAGIERLILSLELEGVTTEPPALDVFLAVDGGSRTGALALLAELRARGIASDTDYAGRSLKGQLTQAQRSGARDTVIFRDGSITLRRRGEQDVDVQADELLERLAS